VGACATAAAYAPLFPLCTPFACARCSAVFLQDTGGGRPEADRPCGGAAQRYPTLSWMDASAPAPSSAAITSARPLTAAQCSGVRLRATAALAAALARADPPPMRPRRQCGPAADGPPVAVGLDVQRCVGVDERADGRQMAVDRRIVQRRPPIPVQCKGGGGVGVAQRVPPTQRSRCPSRNQPCGPPVFFFVFRPAGGWGTWGYSPHSGIPPAARAAAPTRGNAKFGWKRVCEPTAPGKNRNFGQAGMGTHLS
jgi:hypothetical protein